MRRGEPGGKPICGQPGGRALGVWKGTGRQTDLWPTREPGSGCVEGNREANRFVANQGAGLWVCGGGTGRQTDLWPTRGWALGSGCVERNREANRFVANQGAWLLVCGGEPRGKPICGQPGGWALGVWRGTGRQTDFWPTRGLGSGCVKGNREANRFVANQGAGLLVCGGVPGGKLICGLPGGLGSGCVEGNWEANRFVANQGAWLWVCGGVPGGKPICGQPGGGGRALNCLHIVEFTESFRSKLYSPPALFLAVLND